MNCLHLQRLKRGAVHVWSRLTSGTLLAALFNSAMKIGVGALSPERYPQGEV